MGEETLIAAIIATVALIIAGIALVIAVKTSDEVQKLAGELHRAPADINVYETRVTPAIAYSAVEGGKTPEWMATATKHQLNSMRYTRRG